MLFIFKRSFVMLLLFLFVAVVALQTGRRLFFSMAYMLGGTLLFSFLWTRLNLQWVGIGRKTQSERAQVGSPIEEQITVRNKSFLPKLWLEVQDYSELPDYNASRVVHGIGPKRSRSWPARTNARYRGRYRLGPMRIISGDPFGIFTHQKDFTKTKSITIYPFAYELPAFAPPIGRLTGGEKKHRRTHNTTPNFSGVRDYVPGDTLNRIHWRSTARAGRLIVKEFEEDPTADVWVVLDMHKSTHYESKTDQVNLEHDEMFPWLTREKWPEILPITTEYAVTATASIIKHFLDQSRAVGMIAHAATREIIQPDRGSRPLYRVLEHLAVLQANGKRWLGDVLTLEEKFFTRGTTLVLVTSSTHTTWVDALYVLQRRGVWPIVVLINPESFSLQAPSMNDIQASLTIRGIPTYMINKGDRIPTALSKSLIG